MEHLKYLKQSFKNFKLEVSKPQVLKDKIKLYSKIIPTVSLDSSEVLFFDSAKEANNDVNTFLNLKFIKKQKPAVFWENITC